MAAREYEGDVAAAWAAEIERRVREPLPGIPAQTVFDEGRRRLRQSAAKQRGRH